MQVGTSTVCHADCVSFLRLWTLLGSFTFQAVLGLFAALNTLGEGEVGGAR